MGLKSVAKKIKFCFQISSDVSTAVKLILQTFKFSIYYRMNPLHPKITANQDAQIYRLNINGNAREVKLRLQDIIILYEVFFHQTYQLPSDWVAENQSPVIVDLGAHIGLATLFFLLNYFPNGEFICVEASSKNLPLLKFNLKNVSATILEGAIFYHENGIRFTEDALGYNHKIDASSIDNTTPTFSMQGILKTFNINEIHLAKIDIEGAEKYILRKNTDWLSKTNHFIIELHDDYTVPHLIEDTKSHHFQVLLPANRKDIQMICGERKY